MKISVIIPTYRRSRTLIQGLASLQAQTAEQLEIIVVDNAADPDTQRSVEEFNERAKFPARYVPERRIGVHNARHAGALAATGDLFCFTDDDATFDPGWVKAFADAFEAHPEMVAAGGPVRPFWEEAPPEWLLTLMKHYQRKYRAFWQLSFMERKPAFSLKTGDYFYSMNMAILPKALFELGGFNPEAFGDIWLGDGETGLGYKMAERGMLVGYVPQALVYHHIPPQRMTLQYLSLRMANEGACQAYTHLHRKMPGFVGLCLYAAWIVILNSECWLRAILRRGRPDLPSLQLLMDSARTRSQFRYVVRLMFDKRLRDLVRKNDWLVKPGQDAPPAAGIARGACFPAVPLVEPSPR
jgi:glucosyl-dolichyl phosphate glucuronosyltransferase